MSLKASAELSSFVVDSIRYSSHKHNLNHPHICRFSYGSPSNQFSPLSLAAERLGASKVSRSRRVISMSKNEDDGFTYKDAGVDIDAGLELVRRIKRMAPGVGGFGGLFPFGMA